ncbi:MAG: flagellar hook-associated protein FlgK [bacterium]
MSSIGSILSSARGAMQAAQLQMQTTSQNIANAGVEGYTVQKVQLAASYPQHFTYGNVGTGVQVTGVTQSRDRLLDGQYRMANGNSSSANATSDTLGRIEQVMGEPSSTGLSNSLDVFFNAWSDLASDPTSTAARGVVVQRGQQVASMLNGFASQLDQISSDTRDTLTSDLGKINELAKQIADMSPSIVASESGGQTANDLRDSRNRLLDQMSGLADVQVIDRHDGSVGVYLGGRVLVDGTAYHQLAASGGTSVKITFAGEASSLGNLGGTIGANVTSLNTTIPGVMTELDTLAGNVVRQVNQVHTTGAVYAAGSNTPTAAGNFFNQSSTVVGSADPYQTARGIQVSGALSDLTQVAASAFAGAGPGNNVVANQLAGLRDAQLSLTASNGTTVTGSLGSFYRYTVSNVALATSRANNQSTVQGTLATQADTRRQSVSGVATDEELVNLIKQQQAYSAAARLISVVDEMSKTLVSLGQ